MDMREIIERGANYFLPNLSVDVVIIGYEEGVLKCLLLQIGGKWVLPGGYIGLKESVEEATSRVLETRTGLSNSHVSFLSVFGDKDRKFDEEFKQFFEQKGIEWKQDFWIFGRYVTLAYYSLVDIKNTTPILGSFDDAIQWHSFDALPDLWMDHGQIALSALRRLQSDIKREQITYNLLTKNFTMPQLHQLHEVILKEKIDRSRFQKKMLSSGLFERLPQLAKETPGRKPYQYTLKKNR